MRTPGGGGHHDVLEREVERERTTSGAGTTTGSTGSKPSDQNAINQVTSLLGNLFGNNGLGLGANSSTGATGATGLGGLGSTIGGTGAGAGTGSDDTLLGGLLSGLGLGRPAPSYDQAAAAESMRHLRSLAGVGTLLLQGVYA